MNDRKIIEAIHASSIYGAFAVAGGTSAVGRLLEVPGASGTVAEVVVPYSTASMSEYLGGAPDQSVAPEAARAMAMRAFQRALRFPHETNDKVFGIGCTAALRTRKQKRGDHRAFVAAQTLEATHTWSLTLIKDVRDRHQEEEVVSALLIFALATLAELPTPNIPLLDDEIIHHTIAGGETEWQSLVLGDVSAICPREQLVPASTTGPRLIFSGAFNPFHAGHETMSRYAERRYGGQVEYEICVRNVDKPPLNYADIRDRMEHFPKDRRIWLTTAGTFADKAEQFPECTFMVGLDTVVRIADPRYYGGEEALRDEAITRIARTGCRFVVFGRKMGETFVMLRDVNLPQTLADICEEVPEADFRMDLSSTEIRAKNWQE